jgi:hypothetical protein
MIITVVALAIAITVERGREIYIDYDAPSWLSSSVKWIRERSGRAGELLVGEGEEEVNVKISNYRNIFLIILNVSVSAK